MPVLGTPVTWKFAGSLALGGLALASLGMALGWAAWLTGVWWGVSFALGTLALVGMLRRFTNDFGNFIFCIFTFFS